MKQKNKLKTIRISDVFLPAAFLAAACFAPDAPVLPLYIGYLAVHLLSLASCRGVRAAFGWQTSIRQVRGSVKCALLLQIAACIACTLLTQVNFQYNNLFTLPLIVAGGCLNIEHTFYEYLFTVGDGYSAGLCEGLTGLLTLTGLLLTGGDASPYWLTGLCAVSAASSAAVGCVMGDGISGKPNARVIVCAPRALLQSAFFPAVCFALSQWLHPVNAVIPFFAGLSVYALLRTPYRRSQLEARGMNKGLLVLCAVAASALIACLFIAGLPIESTPPVACCALLLAALCAFLMYGNIRLPER